MQKIFQIFNNLSFGLKVGLALVLIGVLPVAIVSYSLLTNATGALQTQTLDKMEAVGKSRQAILERYFQERASEAEVLAGRETLRGNVQNTAGLPVFWQYKHNHEDQDYQTAYQETVTGLQAVLTTHGADYIDVMVYDRIGDRIAQATDPSMTLTAEAQVAELPYFTEAMKGNLYFSDIIENPLVRGQQVYFVSYPVTHYGTTDVIGVVVLKGNPEAIDALLNDPTGLGNTGEAYLVNKDKLMITQARLSTEPTRLVEKVDTFPVQQALAGKSGVASYTDFKSEGDLGYYAPISNRGWIIVAELDQAEAFAPVRQQAEIALVFIVVAVIAALGLAAVLSGYLGRQVGEIQKVFRAAAVGNFDARAKILSLDELGQTANGVNTMLERLTEFMGVAAQAARQRFSDIVTTLSDWVWEVDAEGRYTYCSEQVVDVLGYTAEEMIGKSPFDFMPPEEAQVVGAKFAELIAAKQPIVELENRNVRKDGHEVYLVTSAVPMLDSQGNLRGYRGTDKDITERKQAEERLRESEERLRAVFDNMQDAFYRSDKEGRLAWTSPSAIQMMGYDSLETVIGMDMATGFWAYPEQRDLMVQELRRSGRVLDYEVAVRRKDGSVLPVSTSSSYYRDADGEIVGVEGTFRDITLRKQAEEAIRSSEQLMRSIIDATKDWIFLKDNNYRYMVVNEAFAYEYGRLTPEEMVGKDDYELGTPTYLIEGDLERGIRGFRTDDRAVVEDKQTLTNPYDVVNFRDGTEHVFHTVKAPLYNLQGGIVGVLGVARDITERKLADDQIKEQNEALAKALGELRGLMAGVETAAGQVTGASGSLQSVMELIAGQASNSAEVAEQAAGSAQEGGRAVTDTVSAMGRIRETSQETARRIKRLGEVSQEIGEVVRLIDEIADRVTVLALNASIQAAAAGDAGRGFAVVAEEVQRLAERATGATRQIENLIKGVQGDINEAMVSVEEVTQEVVGGSQLAQNAGERMTELNRVVTDLANLIQHIAQTTSRQTSESLATLTSLAEGLQSSVAALRTSEGEYAGGNGHGDAVSTTTTL